MSSVKYDKTTEANRQAALIAHPVIMLHQRGPAYADHITSYTVMSYEQGFAVRRTVEQKGNVAWDAFNFPVHEFSSIRLDR